MENLSNKISEWDTLIKQGQGQLVRTQLMDLKPSEVPHRFAENVANIARRVGAFQLAIKVLFPYVRSDRPTLNTKPTEVSEYAASLVEIGALVEANELFKSIADKNLSSPLLFNSFLHFKKWEYGEAIVKLRRFLEIESKPYLRLVGKVNLLAALINTQEYDEALELLDVIYPILEDQKLNLLKGNILELNSQIYIHLKQFKKAKECIQKSEEILKSTRNISWLYTQKWKAVIKLLTSPRSQSSQDSMIQVKNLALQYEQWETLRDCDKYLAIVNKSPKLYNHVYYGSPYDQYRTLLNEQSENKIELMDQFILKDEESQKAIKKQIDISRVEIDGDHLKSGHLLHRLVTLLASDFYSPFRVGALFNHLYRGEFFNPHSSNEKVYQLIQRLRNWFIATGFDAEILQTKSHYKLCVGPTSQIIIPQHWLNLDNHEIKESIVTDFIKSYWNNQEFNASDFSKSYGVSKRTANRILKESKSLGHIIQIGRGPQTKYKLAG